jgi:hypothetical protein
VSKEWEDPEPDWVPLRQAVFKFGMTADDDSAGIYDKPLPGLSEFKALSPELLRQAAIEFEASATAPFSRRQLTKMLMEKSGAHIAEIDPITLTFSFVFKDTALRGATACGGPRWVILYDPQKQPSIPTHGAMPRPYSTLRALSWVATKKLHVTASKTKRFVRRLAWSFGISWFAPSVA